MKWKKVMSGVLAGALILSSVTPAVAAVEEIPIQQEKEQSGEKQPQEVPVEWEQVYGQEETDAPPVVLAEPQDGLVASYDFEGEELLANGAGTGEKAQLCVSGTSGSALGTYSQQAVTGVGRTEGNKALQLGAYGLNLNKKNLGKDYTVSLWVKPTQELTDNQAVLFLGAASPEKWLGIAGMDNTKWKIWQHNGTEHNQWKILFRPIIQTNTWNCLTVTENQGNVSAYLNGELLGTQSGVGALDGEDQNICIGANHWDKMFTGLIDDVKVYNRALSAGEVYSLYDIDATSESILEKEGISATAGMTLLINETAEIEVTMPVIVEEDLKKIISYESSAPTVAEVSEQGVVTAKSTGTATITTTVQIGNVSKTAETKVTVNNDLSSFAVASYNFDNSDLSDGKGGSASAVEKQLKSYTSGVSYVDGHGGSGKAVKLGSYGLQLDKKNLGTEYTVSMWMKPDGTLTENQNVMFLGYHDPEKWIGIAGASKDTNKCKIWGHNDTSMKWKTLFSPTIGSDRWHHVTLAGTRGRVTAYVDGVKLGTEESNDPLVGENQNIYIGVTNWDAPFTGAVDDVEVYNKCLTEAQIQAKAEEEFNAILKEKLTKAIPAASILGENENAGNVKYNLTLPSKMEDLDVTWRSNDSCVLETGEVINPTTDQQVTLTASVSSGKLKASVEYPITVKALDKAALNTLIEKASVLDTTYCTVSSKTQLEEAIDQANRVNNFSAVQEATKKLNKAIQGLNYRPEYVNPFDSIEAPETKKIMDENDAASLLVINKDIENMVTVQYKSSDVTKATYENGTVMAKKNGKVTVTAIVTAKYNGWKMEYSTALQINSSVVSDDKPTPTPEVPTPTPEVPTPTPEVPTPTPEVPTPTPEVPTPTPTPADTPIPTPPVEDNSVVLKPDVQDKGDGNVEVKVPEIENETTNVIVNLPNKELSEAVTNSTTNDLKVQVVLPESVADKETLKELNLPKEVLQELSKNQDKQLTVKVSDQENTYSWTMKGSEMNADNISDMNLALRIEDAKENNKVELLKDESGMTVDLKQVGDLPGTVTLTVDGTKYGLKEGDVVQLRTYKEDGSLQVVERQVVVGEGGAIAFQISSSQSFLLTKATPIHIGKVQNQKTISMVSSITLTWDKVKDADGYRIYRYNNETKKYERIAQVDDNSYVDEGVKSATASRYKVRAFAKASKYYFGSYTPVMKVMSAPAAPASVKAKRMTEAGANTTAQISFEKSVRANVYRIFKYNTATKKYVAVYQVKNNKLYQYDSKAKKYKQVSKVSLKKGVFTCTLKNLNLKKEKSQKYIVKAMATKSGYVSGISTASKSVTVK